MKDVIVWDNTPEKTEVGVKKKKEVKNRFEGTVNYPSLKDKGFVSKIQPNGSS